MLSFCFQLDYVSCTGSVALKFVISIAILFVLACFLGMRLIVLYWIFERE